MSDVGSDIPTQPGATTVADAAPSPVSPSPSSPSPSSLSPISPSSPSPVPSPIDLNRARVNAAADKATEYASEAFDKAGDVLSDAATKAHVAAGRAGEALGNAADKAGDAITEATGHAMTRLRNNAELPSERGHTTIANEVVEKIAGIAAREVPGVFDLGGDVARVFSAVKERLHLGDESRAQGVSVRLAGKEAEITITIVIEFGFVISSVTDKVREKVISSVETLLQLDVTGVDIAVDDIHVSNDGPVGDDIARASNYSSETVGVVVGAPQQS